MGALNKRRNEDIVTTALRTAYYQRVQKLPDLKHELMTKDERDKRDKESQSFIDSVIESGEAIYTGGKIVDSEPENK